MSKLYSTHENKGFKYRYGNNNITAVHGFEEVGGKSKYAKPSTLCQR